MRKTLGLCATLGVLFCGNAWGINGFVLNPDTATSSSAETIIESTEAFHVLPATSPVVAPLSAPAAIEESSSGTLSDTGGVLLDDFDIDNWEASSSPGVSVQKRLVTGKLANGLEVSYDLGTSTAGWVQINKNLILSDRTSDKSLEFYVRPSSASKGNLEVRLLDEDGTAYSYAFPMMVSGDWQLVTIPLPNFTYWGGSDQVLNPVKTVQFVVSGATGPGSVAFDSLKLVNTSR